MLKNNKKKKNKRKKKKQKRKRSEESSRPHRLPADPALSATMLLDITIETADGLLRAVLAALAPLVSAGRLRVILAKSFQKYATLGLAKVTAGAAWLLAAPGQADDIRHQLQTMQAALDWASADDCQLLAPLLLHCPDMELRFIARANANASAAHALWPSRVPGDRQVEGLPFVLKDKAAARWAFETDGAPGQSRLIVRDPSCGLPSHWGFLPSPSFLGLRVCVCVFCLFT